MNTLHLHTPRGGHVAARVFELTEGWPLGLQLAADTIERSADAGVALGELSARRGDSALDPGRSFR